MRISLRSPALAVALCALLLSINTGYNNSPSYAQTNSRHFPETGHTVQGRFLEYWEQNGGLPQQGYPLSGVMHEVSETDGKVYAVQYFERAIFELHPENQRPHDVLLSLLGVSTYEGKYPGGAPGQQPNTSPGSVLFEQTGKRLGGIFLEYWRSHGGLAQQGYPLTDEFEERSDINGRTYRVQYFERAVMEYHPENQPPYNVLLSQLGTVRYRAVHAAKPPAIPAPPASGLDMVQGHPRASERYLVWTQSATTGAGRNLYGTSDVYGLDLTSGQVITVADGERDQQNPSISGSIVVWQDSVPGCVPECSVHGIYGKDLATGEQFKVTDSVAAPLIAGKTVAWVESIGTAGRLMSKDLQTNRTVEISPKTLYPLAWGLSEDYAVWLDTPAECSAQACYNIFAYELKTGTTRTVLSFRGHPDFRPVEVVLSGHTLVWSNAGSINVVDVRTGTARSVRINSTPYGLRIKGDTLVWYSYKGEDYQTIQTFGMKLKNLQPVRLLIEGEEENRIVLELAGTWLIYANTRSRPGGLQLASFGKAYAQGLPVQEEPPVQPTAIPTHLTGTYTVPTYEATTER
ncbi:MAG: hypothetical protein M3441_16050 [Chloroflexota bacterium]|nr:hypothetical protein [Chloroflexota bacterium]